jgi:hypothetical protein
MNVTMTFKADVAEASRLAAKLHALINLNTKALAAARKAGDGAAERRLLDTGRKLTINNLIRALVSLALETDPADADLLGMIAISGIKTGRPARAS